MRLNVRLAEHFITFCNKFKKFNNTEAGMLDTIYQMILKLLLNCVFGMKSSRFCHIVKAFIK